MSKIAIKFPLVPMQFTIPSTLLRTVLESTENQVPIMVCTTLYISHHKTNDTELHVCLLSASPITTQHMKAYIPIKQAFGHMFVN